jgi:hypothetical protein
MASVAPGWPSGLGQKLFNFNALRRSISAAEPGAFQRCGGRGAPQGLPKLLVLGNRQIGAPC